MISLLYVLIYIIQRTLVDSSVALSWWCLKKVFRPAQNVLKLYLVHMLFLELEYLTFTWYFYTCVLHIYSYVFLPHVVFDLSMLQAKIFYSLFYSFTEYVVYSLPHFLSFQVRYYCYCYRSWSSRLWWKSLVFISVVGCYSF